ncbi:hypothetical protein ACRAWF_42695 [Streptomyces sp. L7]
MAAGIAYFTQSLVTDGFGWEILPLLGLLMWINLAAVLLNWRVTADSTGLWLAGAWTVRHVPLGTAAGGPQYTAEGGVRLRLSDGSTRHLTGLGGAAARTTSAGCVPRMSAWSRRSPRWASTRNCAPTTAAHRAITACRSALFCSSSSPSPRQPRSSYDQAQVQPRRRRRGPPSHG